MPKQVFLRGSVRELAGDSVRQLLGNVQYARVVGEDPAPFFVSMVIAHEGESRGEVKGIGARVKEWSRKAVRAVVRAFRPSGRVPAILFDGLIHWHGNESSRQPVGEVVYSRVTELAGIEAAETIGYVYSDQADLREAIRRGERDCCSMEADVLMISEGQRLVIDDVERGVAVVLGHTSRQMPGFPLARVQRLCEFEPVETPDSTPDGGGAMSGVTTSTPSNPPAVPAVTPAADATAAGGRSSQPQLLSRDQVLAEARRLGLTAADFSPTPPISPVLIPAAPAPPETPAAAQPQSWDLTNPDVNPFLPK